MSNLDERTKKGFLVYANSVIKSRAIPSVEDNLKPIHRKILYTLWEDKVYPDKPTKKCATEAGRVLAYSPHGDASVYGALVRLSQWWKLRYPLIEMQGNNGNILGDGAAASRYTECRLSPLGMLMLEDLNKDAVDFKPNYDETTVEPITLPSKFPFLLCGNNSGIAVGLSSDLVSHNFTEVASAIKWYMAHKNECSVADLMQFIKGPDFPTGGIITNGEELLNIYTTGRGTLQIRPHYDITKKGTETAIIFHDLPYGVEIDSGIKEPLKKLVIEEGYEEFKDIDVRKVGPHNFDIIITLNRSADVKKCLEILFNKTRLADSVKVNQTVIVNGEPRLLNLKDLIAAWVNYRSRIIARIAHNDYDKTNHKLTVTLGLQKCLSDIDKLINIVRNAENRAAAHKELKVAFTLNDKQADAVLDMKLSRLSRLDLAELNADEKELEETLAKLKDIIDNEETRYHIISDQLDEIKKILGKDERLTEIHYARPTAGVVSDKPIIKKEWFITSDGVVGADELSASAKTKFVPSNLKQVVFAYQPEDIITYDANGFIYAAGKNDDAELMSGFVRAGKSKIVTVTANGNIKVSAASEYKFNKAERVMRLKEDDALIFADECNDDDTILIYCAETEKVLRLNISDLPIASKLTLGVKTGFASVSSAAIISDNDLLLSVNDKWQAKLVYGKDFNRGDQRGNKGQSVPEDNIRLIKFDDGRDSIYLMPKMGTPFAINRNKVSIKGKMSTGAALSTRMLIDVK
jgi:DNA gyrase/topoisomerase IV subunit A